MSGKLKFCYLTLFLLLLIACYQDLFHHSSLEKTVVEVTPHSDYEKKAASFQVVSYQVKQGEQFLTIIEKLNKQQITNIDQLVADFISLNPSADIYQLENGQVYLFPIYQDF
ncbi:hypothetical protein KQI76_11455 [Amphibacillus sp. MSJ-3]|uniref:hypothetical protein n=1 Tax=Amphibacillus sp. MSJ-3 TaxID=2841505 RepID=UPI001C0E9BAB|nr:hypothetical protein [Amphibacillus sp. MSJ-3]MBU5595734.1 hypothetical protein [Amphibacillus sp. MSJ-3]